jgi:YidC/Oxa1 family membrane protein insertase
MSTQSKDTRSNLILIAVLLVGLATWYWAGKHFFKEPPPPNKGEPEVSRLDRDQERQLRVAVTAVSGLAEPAGQPWSAVASVAAAGTEPEKEIVKAEKVPKKKPPTKPEEKIPAEWVTLAGPGSHITARINPHGAGIGQLTLNHFQAADPKTGAPLWLDAEHRKPQPLELIPEDSNREIASYLLYHYPDTKGEDFPLDWLGHRIWKRIEPETIHEGEPVQKAVYETEVQGVKITKTYTLEPRDYHVGLEIKLELADPQAKERTFRYQLTGPHGVPIEGQWYSPTYRNALIGQVEQSSSGEYRFAERNLQDLREISSKGDGPEVTRGDKPIRYAMVANQFFASGIAVATRDQKDPNFLGQARPSLMQSATKGIVKLSDEKPDEVVIKISDTQSFTVFYASPEDKKAFAEQLSPGREVIVVHRPLIFPDGRSREVITSVLDPTQTAPIFHNDITVEVSTPRDDKIIRLKSGIDPETGKPFAVTHKYVLYNGPLKVRLLNHLRLDEPVGDTPAGAPAVDPALVSYYLDDLHLDTLTDYPNNAIGRFFAHIGVTQIVIWFTNRMHDILWYIYSVVKYVMPETLAYGVCILLLTVLVRGAMHPVSRKQARTTMRMQALQPELQKLKEKHKDDKQALQMAQMELYRKHGINPLGSCWMMFLQMPVFLGLYYCLQESIYFRLAPFLWIRSLTAPDMLWHWGHNIPWISTWESYGSTFYLGPYFNVLPVIAVVLMIVQQSYTMPPAADEQAAMQQKMMKWMMILFGLFFYKVAAGLCLYFIASSLWGFAERKLLPKKKADGTPPVPPTPGRTTLMQRLLDRMMATQRQQAGGNGATAAPSPPAPAGGGGKRKRGRPAPVAQEPDGLLARVRAWWAEVLKQAAKK